MRYPLTHKTRQSVIVAVLLLAVGALAAAAAHVSRSGVPRGDIALVNPLPDRAARAVATPDVRPTAPLFAGRYAASSFRSRFDASGAFVPGASAASANGRRFDLVQERRGGGTSYRDFAGERSRRGNSGGSSGGSGGFSAGGSGGGGGWGGVSGTAPARGNSAATSNRGSRATAPGQSGARPGNSGSSNAGGVADTTPAAINSPVIGGVIATGPLGGSPGPSPTPEPLTLLLVGSGLAGLYGARKHLAG